MVMSLNELLLDGLASCRPSGGQCVEQAVKRTLRRGASTSALATNTQRLAIISAMYGVTTSRAWLAHVCAHAQPEDAGLTVEQRRRAADARLLAAFLFHGPIQHIDRDQMLRLVDTTALLPAPQLARIREVDLDSMWWPSEPVPRIALEFSLPTALVRRWSAVLPRGEVEALAAVCGAPGPTTLRANLHKCSRAELARKLRSSGISVREGALAPTALSLEGSRATWGGSVWSLPQWKEGLCEVQDEGSQYVALATEAAEGELVLDMCAGNGGKTLALAAMVGVSGCVVSHDVVERRLAALRASSVRAGVSAQVQIVCGSELDVNSEALRQHFDGQRPPDIVLVDAPCSSSGVMRRHPGLRWSKQWAGCSKVAALSSSLPALQQRLLIQAASLLPIGGRLVYATCALEPSQNEEVAYLFEEMFSHAFEPWPFKNEALTATSTSTEPSHHRTLWPHRHGTDGFFIARWVRIGTEAAELDDSKPH